MKRRNFLKIGAISTITAMLNTKSLNSQISNNKMTDKNKLIKPKVLQKGDLVGIVAPATSVTSPDDIEAAKSLLAYLGLNYKFADNFFSNEGYKTKDARSRANDINNMFANPDVKAIICIRGGYGSMGILNYLDYDLIKNNPKIFIGYSDITAMHLAINKFASLSTLHGAMLLSNLSGNSIDFYKKALFTTQPLGKISNPQSGTIRNDFPTRTIYPGKASGQIIGGNLSLISSLMGTKYEMDTKDKIIFIEDVGEEPYKIDRMLTQLKLAGKFDEAKGIIVGKCQDCEQKNAPPIWDYSLGEVLDYQLKDLKIPTFYGLLIGHTSIQYPIPQGVEVEIDADARFINIIESFCEN
ncbi:MAG: S66 peptidase family protein [Candidatus Kapaibacteriota bacterium]